MKSNIHITDKMYLRDFKDYISYLAILSNMFQFFSGALVFKQYYDKDSFSDGTPLMFIFGVVACSLWFLYGTVKPDDIIMLVNMLGVLLMSSYVAAFYTFSLKRSLMLRQILISLGLASLVIIYSMIEDDTELLLFRLGILACSFTILMIGAPMSKLYYVIKNKSTECLPFPVIVCSFFASVFWFLYGVIVEDIYILVPNSIGGLLASVQLAVFVIIPNKSYDRSPTKSVIA